MGMEKIISKAEHAVSYYLTLTVEDVLFVNKIRHNIPFHKLMKKIYKHVGSQSKYERWDWDELEEVYCSILARIRLNLRRKGWTL